MEIIIINVSVVVIELIIGIHCMDSEDVSEYVMVKKKKNRIVVQK
jgi:hypothetical protein